MRCAVHECTVQLSTSSCASTQPASGSRICPYVCCSADAVEPQQVVVQDDLDQLLDMLPADLGSLLINHPKRPQLIEVRPQALLCTATASVVHVPFGRSQAALWCQDTSPDAACDAAPGPIAPAHSNASG
jgi:hypothetical protein